MDTEAAIRIVSSCRSWLTSLFTDQSADHLDLQNEEAVIRQQLVGCERIADVVDQRAAEMIRNASDAPEGYFRAAAAGVDRLLGVLTMSARIDEIVGPTGPQLSASGLHQWVWGPAARLWDDGHRRAAVQTAATSVFDAYLAGKLQRGPDAKGGKDLAGQAFTIDPPKPGSARLRLPGLVDGTREWTSAHEGAMYLGMGCAQAIRNPATHDLTEPEEDRALEMLAALSLFARLVDEATVITAV